MLSKYYDGFSRAPRTSVKPFPEFELTQASSVKLTTNQSGQMWGFGGVRKSGVVRRKEELCLLLLVISGYLEGSQVHRGIMCL